MGKLIAILFLSRDLAHRAHLQTTSYAQHMALGEFYDSVIDMADDLAEMYQGRKGIIKDIPFLEDEEYDNIADVLESYMKMIEEERFKAVEKTDTTIQNKIDEVIGLYLSTLYKLRNLK